MLAALGHVLPLAVAMAFSSLPLMAAILILLSPQRKRAAIPFLVGYLLGIVLTASVCGLVARFLPEPKPEQPDLVVGVGEIVVGLALVIVALVAWRKTRRAVHPASAEEPAWFRRIGSLGPWSAFAVAVVLGLRPKALLLAVAVGLAIRGAGATLEESAIVIIVYSLVAVSSVAIPIVATLVAPSRAEAPLLRTRAWIVTNSGTVASAIALLIGVVIVGAGLARL